LPPGTYAISVSGKGCETVKREGIVLEAGHLPTIDMALEVSAEAEAVEVSGAAQATDATTNAEQLGIQDTGTCYEAACI
jgi:hypothetical protein